MKYLIIVFFSLNLASCSIYKTEAKKFFEENGVAFFLGEFEAASIETSSNLSCPLLNTFLLTGTYTLNQGSACLWEDEGSNQFLCLYETKSKRAEIIELLNSDNTAIDAQLYFWPQSEGFGNYIMFSSSADSVNFCVFSSKDQRFLDPNTFQNSQYPKLSEALY